MEAKELCTPDIMPPALDEISKKKPEKLIQLLMILADRGLVVFAV